MTVTSARMPTLPRPARTAVKRRLMRQIAQGYQPGDRLPSVRELSRLLSVAPNTAYEAVRELAREGLVELRPRLGAFVADRGADGQKSRAQGPAIRTSTYEGALSPDPVARTMRVAAHLNLGDHFIVDMFEAFQTRAQELGLVVVPQLNPPVDLRLQDDCELAVLFNPDRRGTITGRSDQGVVVINTGVENPDITLARQDTVSVDQWQGGCVAGRALRDVGVERVFYAGVADGFGTPDPVFRETSLQRLMGCERGLGLPVAPEYRSYQESYGIPPGMWAADHYMALPDRPEGVFCVSDELAMGFVSRTIKQRGLQPGVDYQLVGFDGQARSEMMLGHSIASVKVPARDMGRRAAELLVDRVANPEQPPRRLLLGCSLREGTTLRPASDRSTVSTSLTPFFPSTERGVLP